MKGFKVLAMAVVAVALAAGPNLANAAPVVYTPPCTNNSDQCRQQRIVALEKKAAELEGRIKALEDAASPSPSPTTTTTTPTATPTVTADPTATATATTTSTPPATQTCAPGDPGYWTTTSSNNIGDGRTYGEYFIHNNMWNNHTGSGPPGTYTLTACDVDNWSVDVTQQPSTVSPGAVRAYPNVHKDYEENVTPLAGIQSARFGHEVPADCTGCVYNVAFDVWINNAFENELMIWTQNKGQTPAGTRLSDADPNTDGSQSTINIGGKEYQVWKSGGLTSRGGIFTYVSATPQTSGTMPLQDFFKDLESRNWIPANSTTWQVDYGVETVSTAGAKKTFKFTDFAINES